MHSVIQAIGPAILELEVPPLAPLLEASAVELAVV
jgi:hypothetical protein